VRVTDTLDEETPYDLVIVTLLACQVDAALPTLRRSAAECIQFMFVTFEPQPHQVVPRVASDREKGMPCAGGRDGGGRASSEASCQGARIQAMKPE
jgi:hypothetical protein